MANQNLLPRKGEQRLILILLQVQRSLHNPFHGTGWIRLPTIEFYTYSHSRPHYISPRISICIPLDFFPMVGDKADMYHSSLVSWFLPGPQPSTLKIRLLHESFEKCGCCPLSWWSSCTPMTIFHYKHSSWLGVWYNISLSLSYGNLKV